jgi:hypothetical protein
MYIESAKKLPSPPGPIATVPGGFYLIGDFRPPRTRAYSALTSAHTSVLRETRNFVWESGVCGFRAIRGAELQVMQGMMRPRSMACCTGHIGEVGGGFSLRP